MYNRCIWLFVVLTISWLKHASSSSTDSSNSNLLLDVLTKVCPSDGIPVCGVRHKLFFLFPNECLLEAVNKDLLLDNTCVCFCFFFFFFFCFCFLYICEVFSHL